jgi:hypothetical protein
MAITQQMQRERIDMAAHGVGGGRFGGFLAALGAGLRGLGQMRAAPTAVEAAPTMPGTMSELFARAICESSNSATDWLYYTVQLTNPDERRYCAQRALQIDPESEVIRRELRRMGWG